MDLLGARGDALFWSAPFPFRGHEVLRQRSLLDQDGIFVFGDRFPFHDLSENYQDPGSASRGVQGPVGGNIQLRVVDGSWTRWSGYSVLIAVAASDIYESSGIPNDRRFRRPAIYR